MEALLLLIPLGLLAAFAGGGGDDDDDRGPEIPPENEIIEGGNGPQEISGLDGDDLIFGGEDSDTLNGNEGFDILVGDSGNDDLAGGANGDILIGGSGDDTINGGDGGDALISGSGSDQLFGGVGNDDIFGVSGADSLFGGEGDDLIVGYDVGPDDAGQLTDLVGDAVPDLLADRFGDDGTAEATRVQAAIAQSSLNFAADLLDGGDGDDIFAGDLGDTLTGGLGTDEFNVFVEPGMEPVQITDFDTAAEEVFIIVPGLTTESLSFTDGDGGAEVRVDGTVVSVLQGLLVADLDPLSFNLVNA